MFFNLLSAFFGEDNNEEKESMHSIDYEKKIMSIVGMEYDKDYKIYDVDLPSVKGHIHTLEAGFENKEILVLIHGYAASAVFYFKVIKELKNHFHIYSIDLFGLGSSARPEFKIRDFDKVVDFFVEPIEEWRKSLKLENFILMGHSMGGYISAQYLKLKKPPIKMLYLLSPAGFTKLNEEETIEAQKKDGIRIKFILWFWEMFQERGVNPFDFTAFGKKKSIGRYFAGPRLKLTEDQAKVFAGYFTSTMEKRLSGEKALGVLLYYARYSRRPISKFLQEMAIQGELTVPIKVLYGATDWMDAEHSCTMNEKLGLNLEIVTIPDCDHQIIYQNPEGIATILKNDQHRGFDLIAKDFMGSLKVVNNM